MIWDQTLAIRNHQCPMLSDTFCYGDGNQQDSSHCLGLNLGHCLSKKTITTATRRPPNILGAFKGNVIIED